MSTIWKFDLTADKPILVPGDYEVRHGGLDPDGTPCVWVEVNPDTENEDVRLIFKVFGTGRNIPKTPEKRWCYVNTFLEGPFVWHLFWRVAE